MILLELDFTANFRRMTWKQLCDDRTLENLPYRVELARRGRLVMSPHRSYHSIFQSRIIRHLNALLPKGEAMPECPIQADTGTVVADVAWASPRKVKRNFDLPEWTESPEIVIEVLSPSNAAAGIRAKRNAVFARGAVEFWVCDRKGTMQFFNPEGRLAKSALCPRFPASVARRG
jgi:Uma2 family endonuclease